MSSTIDTLRRMAGDIARNLESMGHDQAVLATADHIHQFWDPRMKAMIFADDPANLIPIAREAIAHLQKNGHPGSQTRATKFNDVDGVGRSDAG
ncbi:MAG TPA: formate dehydrogenase subunit delta [Croceibacterium sp.]|nr:formate dehydrogenase subunit delta [Croceibacterium sp.]